MALRLDALTFLGQYVLRYKNQNLSIYLFIYQRQHWTCKIDDQINKDICLVKKIDIQNKICRRNSTSAEWSLGLWSHKSIRYTVFAIWYTIRCPPQTRFRYFHVTSLECRLWRRANRIAYCKYRIPYISMWSRPNPTSHGHNNKARYDYIVYQSIYC